MSTEKVEDRANLAAEIDKHLAACAELWRGVLRLDRSAADKDFRQALAVAHLPGGWRPRGVLPRPLSARMTNSTEGKRKC